MSPDERVDDGCTSSLPTIYRRVVRVKRCGGFSGVILWLPSLVASTSGESVTPSYATSFIGYLRLLGKTILSLLSQYRLPRLRDYYTLSLMKCGHIDPFTTPSSSREETRKIETMYIPARALDDYMVCKLRARFTLDRVRGRENLAWREETRDVDREAKNELLFVLENHGWIAWCDPMLKLRMEKYCRDGRLVINIAAKPDILAIERSFRKALVIEFANTFISTPKAVCHIIPRLLLYSIATKLRYGIFPTAMIVSLDPGSPYRVVIPAIPKESWGRLAKILTRLSELRYRSLDEITRHIPPLDVCRYCPYENVCPFADRENNPNT